MKRIASLLAGILLLTGCGCSAQEPVDSTKRSSASSEGTIETTAPATELHDSTAAAQGSETTVLTETVRTTDAASDQAERLVSGSPAQSGTQSAVTTAETQKTTSAGGNQTAVSKTTTSKTTINATRGTVTTSKTTTSKTTTTTTKKNNSSEPEIDGYKLSEIVKDGYAFGSFGSGLQYDLGHVSNSKLPFSGLSFSYGVTTGGYESLVMLFILNCDYINSFNSNVFNDFSEFGQKYLYMGKEFFSKYKYITTTLGTSVDFTQYTLNHDKGLYLNRIVDEYKSGNFEKFIVEQYVNKKMDSKFLNDPAVLTLLCSFDSSHKYISQSYLDENYLNHFINELSYKAYGTPYYT